MTAPDTASETASETAPEATELDLDALFSARRFAKRRAPNGDRLVRWRWAEEHGAVWVFPAALVSWQGLTSRAAASDWQVSEMGHPVAFSFWLATAARQDLWRSLKGVPGLLPAVRVIPEPKTLAVNMTLGAVVTPKRASPAIEGALQDLFQPRRLNAWSAWALRQTKAGAAAAKR